MSPYLRVLTISSLLLSTVLAAPVSRAQEAQAVPGKGLYTPKAVEGDGPYCRPARMADLGYLTPGLYNTGLNRLQWTEVLLTWLVEEKNNPTPTSIGGGGGSIDSSYLQAQIIKALGSEGSPFVLSLIAESPTLNDEDVRDAVRLALARMGDRRQAPALRRVLAHHQDPYFRALAAEGMQNLGDIQSLPLLRNAVQDQYSVAGGNCMTTETIFFPVRQAAKQALHFLPMPTTSDAAQERSLQFDARFEIERQTTGFSSTATNKLITALNSHKRTRIARSTPKK